MDSLSPPLLFGLVDFYHIPSPAEYFSAFHFVYIAVFGVPFLQAGRSWFLLFVESAPCGWGWSSGLSTFPGWGNLCLCSGGWSWISSLECSEVSSSEFWGLVRLWTGHLLMFRVVVLFC